MELNNPLSPRRYGKTGLVCHFFNALSMQGGYSTIYTDLFGTQCMADFTRPFANAVNGAA